MSYSPNFRGTEITSVNNASITGGAVTNSAGITLTKLTPVKINTSGVISMIDVSSEESLSIAGVLTEDIFHGSTGIIASTGIIKDINVGFALGDTVYVSKTGGITNIKPEIGSGSFITGDYVIRIGVIGKNEDNSLNMDLYLNVTVVGQL